MGYKSIKNWPEGERPRESLLRHGSRNLSEAQLLAIILRTGGGGKSALDLAIEILDSFKDLKKIESASLLEFTSFKGMGKAKVAQLKAAFDFGRRLTKKPYIKGHAFLSAHTLYT